VSRHRAHSDDDDASLAPPPPPPASSDPSLAPPPPPPATSDTGPLFIGHSDLPPLRPAAGSSEPARGIFSAQPVGAEGASESDPYYLHATTPVPAPMFAPVERPVPSRHPDVEPDDGVSPAGSVAEHQPAQRRFDAIDEEPADELIEDPADVSIEEPAGELIEDPADALADEPADDLGLLAAPPAVEGGNRGRRRSAGPRKGRRPLAAVVTLGLVAALVTGIYYGGRFIVDLVSTDPAADYSGQGSGTVEVEVAAGASTAQIAEVLVEGDVVASAQAFLDAASGNPDVMTIQPGIYQMREQMSGEAAVALILDPASRLFNRATIPEGYTVSRTIESLAEQTEIPLADFEAAAAAPEQLGLPPWSNGQLEGFLYPSTYDIGPDTSAAEVLASMVARFNEMATEAGLETNASALGLTPYELLTVASMVQSEVTVEAERPLVARVIYNRLDQDIPLGIDATLAYELGINGNDLTTDALNTDSPYNTRIRLGLPPTPISNPGQPSVLGALQPAVGDWIYYVLQNVEGDHLFTADYEEFLAAKAQCEAAGLGCGGG